MKSYGNINLPDSTPDRPLVSFTLFAYNQEKYIQEAIAAAFAQTYEPLEIILSDDCSSDRTFAIMKEMASGYGGPHKVSLHCTEENLGHHRFGRRVGDLLSLASGDFIVLAAGDDISSTNRCEVLATEWVASGRPDCCIHSHAKVIDEHGDFTGVVAGDNSISGLSRLDFLKQDGRGLIGATNAISRSLVEDFPSFPETIAAEDGLLAFRAHLKEGIKFIPEALVLYRRHGGNISNFSLDGFSKERLDREIRGLLGVQQGFLQDYLSAGGELDRDVILQISKRQSQILRIKGFFSRNPLKMAGAVNVRFKYLGVLKRMRLYLSLLKGVLAKG